MNRANLAGVSTHGLHSASWRNIRKALRKLGGRPLPATNKHDSILMTLPTDTKIAVGKGKDTDEQVRVAGLQQLLVEIRNARLDPVLFLAVLDGVGCAWITKPAEVTLLERYLRHGGHAITTEAAWRRVLADFARSLSAREIQEVSPMPKPESTPAPEPEAPATEASPWVRPPKDEPAPAEDVTVTHPFTIPSVIDAAGVPDDRRRAATTFTHDMVKRGKHGADALLASGDIIRVRDPQYRSRMDTRFTEAGALAVAERLAHQYPTAPTPDEPEDPEHYPEIPTEPAPQPDPEPTPDPEVSPTVPEPTPTTPKTKAPPKFDGVGEAIAFLCYQHATLPKFMDGDLLRIDVDATVLMLGNLALKGAHESMIADGEAA